MPTLDELRKLKVPELKAMLAERGLDITSIECSQRQQIVLHSDNNNETKQMFRVSGVVRSFSPVNRSELKATLAAFEEKHGIKCAIEETLTDPTFSALSPSADGASGRRKLVQRLTGVPSV